MAERVLTEERRAAIVRLLAVLTDGLPVPVRAPMSTLGFVHRTSSRESCPDCLANGFASRDCETCEGRGFLERRRVRDPYDTGAAPGWFGSSAAKHERGRERDAELDRLEAQLAEPRPETELVAAARPERWETERARLRAAFHVAELEGALEVLAAVDVDAYRAAYAVHVYGWAPDTGRARVAAARAVVFVAGLLPDPLRAPPAPRLAAAVGLTLPARNREIRKWSKEGAASQWIAGRYGLSVAQVNRILAGDDREEAA